MATAVMLAGCAIPKRSSPEPRALLGKAEVVGMPGVR